MSKQKVNIEITISELKQLWTGGLGSEEVQSKIFLDGRPLKDTQILTIVIERELNLFEQLPGVTQTADDTLKKLAEHFGGKEKANKMSPEVA